MTSFFSSSSLAALSWLTGDSQHLKWGGGVLYHSSSGRIFLVFGQDPSHSDGTFVPYMRYDPPCTATRPISFASDHLNCLRPNRTKPSQAMHHQIFSRQMVNYHTRHDLDSALRLLLLRRQGSGSLWKGDNRHPDRDKGATRDNRRCHSWKSVFKEMIRVLKMYPPFLTSTLTI